MSQMNEQSSLSFSSSGSVQLVNMALRMAILGSRFVLTLYIAKALGIGDLGIYGLVMGLVGVVPAISGWGLNYFVSRKIVGLPLQEAAIMVRDRLVVTVISLIPILLFVPGLSFWGIIVQPERCVLIAAIIIVETISSDMQPALVSLGMSLFANALLFCRGSAWVFVFIAIGTFLPAYRTLDTAFELWLSFDIIQFVLLYFVVVRHANPRRLITTSVDFQALLKVIRTGLSIYSNDVGGVGLAYVDRYIVGAMLSLSDLGIFTLYWSISNSVNAVITSAIVQPATPVLIKSHASGAEVAWKAMFAKMVTSTLSAGLVLGVGAAAAAWIATSLLRIGDFATNYPFLLLLLVAATLRSLSDALNLALASRHMDRAYSIVGFAGMLLAVPLTVVGLSLFALPGVALAGCATQAILVAVKLHLLRSHTVVRYVMTPAD